ncbi:MAG: glycosyl hydrolase family 28 protein [Duganella sp.]
MTAYPTRRRHALAALSALAWAPWPWPAAARSASGADRSVVITAAGAVADGATAAGAATINTRAIQAAIDGLAQAGGGTVVVPPGVFVSGALFLKPAVHLHLERGAVLRCSTDLSHFPVQRTRIEGHFEEAFNPGLINASGCDGLRITGEGTLDGAGRPVWDLFWKLRNAAPDPHNFPNLGVPRARLAVIERSRGVMIDGVTFKDAQFWNLHLYRCQDVNVRNARFEVPDDYKQAPSSDGIDLDSCQHVTIERCYFSVTDDCIAAKGSKGPRALEDRDSPPVEHVRVRHCHFRRGHGVFTLGSEATIVRDVVVEHCTVTDVDVAVIKLRTDTPQLYEDIHFRHLTLNTTGARGALLLVRPWTQYADLKGAAPPQSVVRNITMTDISGNFVSFGSIRPNPGQTALSDIVISNCDLTLVNGVLAMPQQAPVRFENVRVNGAPYSGA